MIWDYLRHFTPKEAWGDPSRMNGILLLLLDTIRSRWGDAEFIIHCGFESGGHTKDSEHKRGSAVDFHIKSELSFPEQIKRMEMILRDLQVYDKVGLGIYPDWNRPGFHLDVRGSFARWGRIGAAKYVGWHDAIDHAARIAAKGGAA